MRNGGNRPLTRARLCALAELADGETRLVPTADPGTPDFFLVRRGGRVHGYVNDCPHRGLPLDLMPGRFLDRAGAWILCTNHGARFDIDTGVCATAPCRGAVLTRVPLAVAGGAVYLAAETAGRWRLVADPAVPGNGRGGGLPE